MKSVKDIFFDLDHTLWDFEKNSGETLHELHNELELNSHTKDAHNFIEKYQEINHYYWKLYRDGKIEKAKLRVIRFQETLEHFGINDDKLAERMGEEYLKRCPQKRHLFPDAIEVLEHLSKNYKLHIITNGFLEVQHIKTRQSGIHDFFDLILCSEEVGVNKPHPDIFHFAMKSTNAKAEESVMIGDTYEADILGAKSVGMKTIFFNPKKELVEEETLQIHELKELIDIFL